MGWGSLGLSSILAPQVGAGTLERAGSGAGDERASVLAWNVTREHSVACSKLRSSSACSARKLGSAEGQPQGSCPMAWSGGCDPFLPGSGSWQ